MGSFQQISLGVICLVAAFVFGNYVNNNPLTNQPDGADAVSGLVGNQMGNVQSRLTTDPFAGIEKQPAPMLTMNRQLTSRFSVPKGQLTPTTNQSDVENRLPPPSQLSSNEQKMASPVTNPSIFEKPTQNVTSEPTVQIPDFSAIAAEIKQSAIKLPRMGMPMHSNSESPVNARTPSSPLKDLVSQFNPPTGQNPNVGSGSQWNQPPANNINAQPMRPVQSNTLAKLSEPENSAPWNQAIKQPQGFTSDDFESKLNDNIFGLKQPRPAAIAPAETATHRDWRENAQADWPAKQTVDDRGQAGSVSGDENLTYQNHVAAKPSLNHPIQAVNSNTIGTEPTNSVGNQPQAGFRNSSSVQNQVRTRLPFGLTESARTEMVALRTNANSKIGLETTKFVDHVVEPGESLQSISTRYFGRPDYYLDIYIANRGKLRNPEHVQTGLTLRVPIYESP